MAYLNRLPPLMKMEVVRMSLLGNPFVGNAQQNLTAEDLAQALRVEIIGEMEAIVGM